MRHNIPLIHTYRHLLIVSDLHKFSNDYQCNRIDTRRNRCSAKIRLILDKFFLEIMVDLMMFCFSFFFTFLINDKKV